VRAVDGLHELTHHVCTRGVGELSELLQVLIRGATRAETLARRADENCAFDQRLNRDELFTDGYLPSVLYRPFCE
jgi:hypothetical protein